MPNPNKIQPNINESSSHDAKLAAEQIASNQEKSPQVDFEADYVSAQQFSVSDIDRTDEGKIAAEAATATQLDISELEVKQPEVQSTRNRDDYLEMAEEIESAQNESVTNVSDDLVQQALQNKPKPKK